MNSEIETFKTIKGNEQKFFKDPIQNDGMVKEILETFLSARDFDIDTPTMFVSSQSLLRIFLSVSQHQKNAFSLSAEETLEQPAKKFKTEKTSVNIYYQQYIHGLFHWLECSDADSLVPVFANLAEMSHFETDYVRFWAYFLRRLLSYDNPTAIRVFFSQFLCKHLDLCFFLFYTLRHEKTLITREINSPQMFFFLKKLSLNFPATKEDFERLLADSPPFFRYPQKNLTKYKLFKALFSKCWLSFLSLPISREIYIQSLHLIPDRVLPFLSNPILLMDFYSNAYKIGSVSSVLALKGIHHLMQEHNLEYPKFYTKMYRLLTPDIFYVDYRSPFFLLLAECLSSRYIPSYVIASFAKRLSRMNLSAPPSGILILLPLIYNILFKHPEVRDLLDAKRKSFFLLPKHEETPPTPDSVLKLHKDSSPSSLQRDPFDNECLDLSKNGALQSYLWELATMEDHYFPLISQLAKQFSTPTFARSSYDIKKFVSQSYDSLFQTEITRKQEKLLPLNFQFEEHLFQGEIFSHFWKIQ